MTTQHTAGPWEVRPSSNPKNGTAWRDIVSLGGEFSPSYVGEALEQDARLIAAAPELLAALIELERVESSPHSETLRFLAREQAREAIAKATGEEVQP